MDLSPELEGASLRLRPLQEADRDALYAACSDPLIWEQHPARTRHERMVFDPYFDHLIASPGSQSIIEKTTGRIIGTSRFYCAPIPPDSWSIGFTFLTRDHWGGKTNFELKSLMIRHLMHRTDTVWFHIAPDNLRSQKATAKLGAVFDRQTTVDLGTGPTEMVFMRLNRPDWEARLRANR